MKHHLIRMGARPLMALPAGSPRQLADACLCYPAHTVRKRALRAMLWLLCRIGLVPWLFPAREDEFPGLSRPLLAACLEGLAGDGEEALARVVLIWPADPQRGRMYLHQLGPMGEPRAFGKLATRSDQSRQIDNEGQWLQWLAGLPNCSFRFPALLSRGEAFSCSYLWVSPTPQGSRAVDWTRQEPMDSLVAEYAGEAFLLTAKQRDPLDWWSKVRKTWAGHTSGLFEWLEDQTRDGIRVSRAHGDLNQTNLLLHGEEVWLIDWEQACEQAPCMTDRVCMRVDALWPLTRKNPAAAWQTLVGEMMRDAGPTGEVDLYGALLYLDCVGFTPASDLLRHGAGLFGRG